MDKKELRRIVTQNIKAADSLYLEQSALIIADKLQSLPLYRQAKAIMAFIDFDDLEINMQPILAAILSQGKTLALPYIYAPHLMLAKKVDDLTQLSPDCYGIPSPTATMPTLAKSDLDLILVPGLAFDSAMGRLGRGAGFYDNFLKDYSGYKLGICRRVQIVESALVDENDVLMDMVLFD